MNRLSHNPAREARDRQYTNRISANIRLMHLPDYDRLIDGLKLLDTESEMSAAQMAFWRANHRLQYCHCTGVEMEQRNELERGLRELVETGSCSPDELVAEIQARHRKKSCSALVGDSPISD